MNTYDVSTSELLKRYGALTCAKHGGISYQTIFNNVPKDKLKSNWHYFEVRVPLIKMDGGEVHTRTIKPKVTCEQHTRESWMKVWDDAHTRTLYNYIANEYETIIE